jgi:hypothetical protein
LIASKGDNQRLAECLSDILVEEMDDGGMGSLRFVDDRVDNRKFGAQVAEAAFLDEDGVPVSITLNIDERGELFELDLFKADNTPLRRFPLIGDIEFVSREHQTR